MIDASGNHARALSTARHLIVFSMARRYHAAGGNVGLPTTCIVAREIDCADSDAHFVRWRRYWLARGLPVCSIPDSPLERGAPASPLRIQVSIVVSWFLVAGRYYKTAAVISNMTLFLLSSPANCGSPCRICGHIGTRAALMGNVVYSSTS